MGLFSTKTKIYVASSTYNLAGDEDLRPNVVKAILLNSVLGGAESIADNLRNGLIHGPGARPRDFLRWAKNNYVYALPTANLIVNLPVSNELAYSGMAPFFDLDETETLLVLSSVVDDADIHYWAEAWILENLGPTDEDTWSAEWETTTNEIIIFIGDEEEIRIPAPDDLIWGAVHEGRKLFYASYRILTTDPITKVITEGPLKMFVYRMGSGSLVLDMLGSEADPMAEFFPVLPLRMKKRFIDHEDYSEDYPIIEKGFKKLTGAKLTDLLETIKENDNMGDVDGIYVVQGVSFNTKENAGREYIYKFLKRIMEQTYSIEDEIPISVPPTDDIQQTANYAAWLAAHLKGDTHNPLYGTSSPVDFSRLFTTLFGRELRIISNDLLKADFRMSWSQIQETTYVGNCKTFDGNLSRGKAKIGDYWFHVGGDWVHESPLTTSASAFLGTVSDSSSRVQLFHQYSARRYTCLTCTGLTYKNYIYKGHSTSVTARQALEDDQDEESSFVVPMHMPTLRSLGAAKSSQLVTSSSYVVLNSYKKVKIKWYQRGIFKVVLIVASIAIAMLNPAALGATMGILGTNASVGLALGASATAAAVIGAIANGIAAMVVSTLMTKAATAIFGEKLGAIIGMIASFVAFTYATQYMNHGNFSVNWGQMMRADNLLKMTNSATKAYTQWLNADTALLAQEMEELSEEHTEAMEEVQNLYKEVLGMTGGELDPMLLLDASEHFGESSEAFLSRTLLTGSDIANLSFTMIENFASISLELHKAGPSSHS